jgi:hypothetical protein
LNCITILENEVKRKSRSRRGRVEEVEEEEGNEWD